MQLVESLNPDFIILDIMLPDVNGIELCQQIRDITRSPILILSARGSDTDKVLGLGFGADDYMTKPFSLNELVARIQAHLRRIDGMETQTRQNEVLTLASLTMDKKAYKATLGGEEISLSAKEFELLYFLAMHKNQVFSKGQWIRSNPLA